MCPIAKLPDRQIAYFRASAAKFARSVRPLDWLFSGWNWVAKRLSRQITEVKRMPYSVVPAVTSGSAGST